MEDFEKEHFSTEVSDKVINLLLLSIFGGYVLSQLVY